jgi:hypothetical protein
MSLDGGHQRRDVEGFPELDRRMPAIKPHVAFSEDCGASDFNADECSPLTASLIC